MRTAVTRRAITRTLGVLGIILAALAVVGTEWFGVIGIVVRKSTKCYITPNDSFWQLKFTLGRVRSHGSCHCREKCDCRNGKGLLLHIHGREEEQQFLISPLSFLGVLVGDSPSILVESKG